MNNTTDLWIIIKDARDSRGWTNERLSAESGVPESSIQKYLTGKTAEPRFDSVVRLCRALSISVDAACGIDSNAAVEEIAQLRAALALAEERAKTAEAQQKAADAQRETAETRLQSKGNEYDRMVEAYEYRIDIAKDRTIWLRWYLIFSLAILAILIFSLVGILIYDVTHLDRGWVRDVAAYYYAGTQRIIDFFA